MRIALTLVLASTLACAHATGGARSTPAQPPETQDGCSPGHALVNATLWVQSSAEYRAGALQAYAAARSALDAALADPSWVGATEESGTERSQPPAIVLDLDETAIDNTAYEARMITRGIVYDLPSWNQWVSEAAAKAVPGAAEFLAYAKSRGVTPFYVTNREAREEAGTRRNLEALGFPLGADPERPTLLATRVAAGVDEQRQVAAACVGCLVVPSAAAARRRPERLRKHSGHVGGRPRRARGSDGVMVGHAVDHRPEPHVRLLRAGGDRRREVPVPGTAEEDRRVARQVDLTPPPSDSGPGCHALARGPSGA